MEIEDKMCMFYRQACEGFGVHLFNYPFNKFFRSSEEVLTIGSDTDLPLNNNTLKQGLALQVLSSLLT